MYNGLLKKVISLTGIGSKLKEGGGSRPIQVLEKQKIKKQTTLCANLQNSNPLGGGCNLQCIVKLKSSFRFRMPLLWIKTLKAEI